MADSRSKNQKTVRQDLQDRRDFSRSPDESGKTLSRCAAAIATPFAHAPQAMDLQLSRPGKAENFIPQIL
jgi:hypothetical protein